MPPHTRTLSTAAFAVVGLILLLCCCCEPAAAADRLPCSGSNFKCVDNTDTLSTNADGDCQCCSTAQGSQTCTLATSFCTAAQATSGCSACGQYGECVTCSTGLQVVNDTCQACSITGCDVCYPGDGNQCRACSDNHDFINEFTCNFYSIDNGTLCGVDNCGQCIQGQASVCYRCNPWFTIDITGLCNSQCSVENCQSCYAADETHCQLCYFNYQPQSEGTLCVASPGACRVTHCLWCTGAAEQWGRCDQCEDGYVKADDGLCKRCNVPFCEKCDPNNTTRCSGCAPGFMINAEGQCVPVPCNVPGCYLCATDDPDKCIHCLNESYILNAAGQCVDKDSLGSNTPYNSNPSSSCSVANCAVCVPGNPYWCQQCNAQYTVNAAGTCGLTGYCRVINCVTCMPGDAVHCRTCRSGYGLSTQGLCVAYRRSTTTTTYSAAAVPPQTLVAAMVAVVFAAVCAFV